MTQRGETEEDHCYQIGTVSTLTGLDSHTIRAWERRHGAIVPSRTETGHRRYDDDTVERLQLLKTLVDCGESIGTIAHLGDAELRGRLERLASLGTHRGGTPTAEMPDGSRRWRLGVLAPRLAAQLRASPIALPELELAVDENDREKLLARAGRQECEIIILELEAIGARPLAFVQACRSLPNAPLVVVLYRFAQRAALARLVKSGARLIQMPLRLAQLRRTILDQLIMEQARSHKTVVPAIAPASPPAAGEATDLDSKLPVRPRLFDDEQLARLFEVSTGIDCECPNHLSSLVSALVAFETYSRSCESKDEADIIQHRRLADGTGEARARLEILLVELCEHEGIVV